jgi:hypothetical protein
MKNHIQRFFVGLIKIIRRHEVLCLFTLVYLVYIINFRTIGSGDTIPASLLPFSILENHNLYLDQFSYYFESNYEFTYGFLQKICGHTLSVYPIVTPVLITPLYILPFVIMKLAHIPMDMFHPGFALIMPILEKLSASLIASFSTIFVFLSVRELINKRIAIIVALIFAFATNTWTISSQGLWQHGLVELLLAMSIYLVLINEKHASDKIIISLGIISGLFVFNRPVDSILLIPIVYYIFGLRARRIAYYLCAMSISGAPFLLYNIHYFGNLFGGMSYALSAFDGRSGFILPFMGLLISPSRGLFVYTPIMLFSILGYFRIFQMTNSKIRKFLFVMGISILALIIVYASFGVWWAGWSYGPRFLTGMLPALVMFLGLYIKNINFNIKYKKNLLVVCIFSIFLIWSVFAQIVGAFYYPLTNSSWDADPNVDHHPEKLWYWNDTQIMRSFNSGIIISPGNYLRTLQTLLNPPQDIMVEGTLGNGWYGIEIWDGTSTRWMENDALVTLYSPEDRTANLSLRLMSFYRPRTLVIYAGNESALRANVSSAGFEDMIASIHLMKGTNTVRFHIPEGCERPRDKPVLKNEDTRCLGLAFQKIKANS